MYFKSYLFNVKSKASPGTLVVKEESAVHALHSTSFERTAVTSESHAAVSEYPNCLEYSQKFLQLKKDMHKNVII